MSVLSFANSALLAVAFGGAGYAKVSQQQAMLDSAEHLGYEPDEYRLIGALELAGAGGLLVGQKLPLVGAASSAGLATAMALAVSEHLAAGDEPKDYAPAAVLGALSATATVLFLAEAAKKRKAKKAAKKAKKRNGTTPPKRA